MEGSGGDPARNTPKCAPCRLLRFGGERRESEAESENDHEPEVGSEGV